MKLALLMALLCTPVFAQKTVFKVKIENNKIRLVPYMPVQVEVKTLDGSGVPQDRETVSCKPVGVTVGESADKKRKLVVTHLDCGDLKFEVKSWVLTAQ